MKIVRSMIAARSLLCLLLTLSALATQVHASDSIAGQQDPQATLRWGSVTPDSGQGSTFFTYRVNYQNSANIAPDHVWLAIWWGSYASRYWYEMQPADPSDTDYADGVWYTAPMCGLDCSSHFFRFVAETAGGGCLWPGPDADYQPGPAVTGPPVLMGVASVQSDTGPQPGLLVQANKEQVGPQGYVVFTVTVTLPQTESLVARGVTVTYTSDAMFSAVDGAAPLLFVNSATLLVVWRVGSQRHRHHAR